MKNKDDTSVPTGYAESESKRATHSKLPWKKGNGSGYCEIRANNNLTCIADVWAEVGKIKPGEEEMQANAAFIVKACNNHYKLLEVLKELIECISETRGKDATNALFNAKEAIKEAEE
jgi:hypothetical protein